MSSWKLVEAIPEAQPNNNNNNSENSNKLNSSRSGNKDGQRGQGRGYRQNNYFRGGRSGRGRDFQDQGQYQQQIISEADRKYFAFMAVQQIELIFSTDNLCMDTYIRSYMDEAGYVPIALVLGYPNVAGIYAQYYDIIQRLQEISESGLLEVDSVNETIRLKEGWEVWLLPNAFGGRGQPRYIKQTYQQYNIDNNYNEAANNDIDNNNNNNNNDDDNKEPTEVNSELDKNDNNNNN